MKQIQGIPASPGIAIGPVFRYSVAPVHVEEHAESDVEGEWARLEAARQAARAQLKSVREQAARSTDAQSAEIFEAQAVMLDDPALLERCKKALNDRRVNVEVVWRDSVEHFAASLEALPDEYLSARAADVRDVGQRVLRLLAGGGEHAPRLQKPSIITAKDLAPSDTVTLDKSLVLGFCTAMGGPTSHTAILARSLGLPAVVGAAGGLEDVEDGAGAVLDGVGGNLFVDPDSATLAQWEARRHARLDLTAEAHVRCREPAVTTDGVPIEIVANIGSVDGARAALENGAEGVGLLRTEFLYLERPRLPDEAEQAGAYKEILDVFGAQPVVLRTLDIGGDKAVPYLDLPSEANPFLGVRGLRLCLRRPDLFKPQLRAALQASPGRNLKIMFPMVASVEELKDARAQLETCVQELRSEGRQVADEIEVGIMVEVPSAALLAEVFAPHVDFFSVGTNDLTQYTLAVDRTNPDLAALSSAFSPAVLRLIDIVVQEAHRAGAWAGVCGELGGEPLALPLLLGLGLDELSMNGPAIPLAKQILRRLSFEASEELARRAMHLEDARQVQELVVKELPWLGG